MSQEGPLVGSCVDGNENSGSIIFLTSWVNVSFSVRRLSAMCVGLRVCRERWCSCVQITLHSLAFR
jgi:hypothetical protein